MADSLSLRQRASTHTSYWPWYLAVMLRSSLEERRLARLISLLFATSALSHRSWISTTYTVKELCLSGR